MAKDKLIPRQAEDDGLEPHERFSDLATKIFTVPKAEIDVREKQWKRDKVKHALPKSS